MSDPKSLRPAPRPQVSPAKPAAVPAAPASANGTAGQPPANSGKVEHDERGNAVWRFVKETSRICVESTTRMLKKLESPELKVEDTNEHELRIMPDSKAPGGGYDPYNQPTKSSRRTPLKK